jgi:transcriptional regulator with XRE-family HTH domain
MSLRRRVISEHEVRERLRRNVRAYRSAASLTADQAARRVQMHLRHWQKIEAGAINVTMRTLARVSVALGIDAVTLLGEPQPPGSGTSGL